MAIQKGAEVSMEDDASKHLTEILGRVNDGGDSTTARLLPLVYQELRSLAGSFFGCERPDHTLQPTALVHEAYVRIVGTKGKEWTDRKHFFEVAAKVMRHVLTDHARASVAQKRGRGWKRVTISQEIAITSAAELEPIEFEEALSTLEQLHERQARIVELRFLAGLNIEEVAEILEVSRRTVELDWRTARAFLKSRLQSATTP
jgi:RNA polymerase sigma factor (TIGR02999 family)